MASVDYRMPHRNLLGTISPACDKKYYYKFCFFFLNTCGAKNIYFTLVWQTKKNMFY